MTKEALSVEDTLKLALEALETLHDENMDYIVRNKLGGENNQCMVFARDVIKSIKRTLAQPEQEPVSCANGCKGFFKCTPPQRTEQEQQIETLKRCLFQMQEAAKDLVKQAKSLPSTQRTWVGLTHEDIDKAIEDNQRIGGFRKVGFAYDLEAILKEKNT